MHKISLKTILSVRLCMWEIVHVKEQACAVLIITWYSIRNCTKLVLKPLAAKNDFSISTCVLLLSWRLYNDYPPLLYTTQSFYIAELPFLVNWNKKRCGESNILTMDHELVLKNSSSAALYTLQNNIAYLKAIKYQVSDWDIC